MPSSSKSRLLLTLLLPLCLAAQDPWKRESINNTVLVTLPPGAKGSWALEFLSGRGDGDAIRITSARSPKLAAELNKPGDIFVFKGGQQWNLTFNPNLGQDGCHYGVKLLSKAARGGITPMKGQYIICRAEKPVDTLLSLKSKRRITLIPDWKVSSFHQPKGYPGLGSESIPESEVGEPGGF